MLLLVMPPQIPTAAASPSPAQPIRLDPSPSKVFSWLHWLPDQPEVLDDRGRVIQPASSVLHVRYRTNGSEWIFWPVSEEEARRVMSPGPGFDFSIGRAFGEVIKAHKSGRGVKSGDRQATKAQREEIEQRAGRRWLA